MTSDLARQYRSKMSELELRQIELNRISAEFETRMRKKEVNIKCDYAYLFGVLKDCEI